MVYTFFDLNLIRIRPIPSYRMSCGTHFLKVSMLILVYASRERIFIFSWVKVCLTLFFGYLKINMQTLGTLSGNNIC